MNGDSAANSNSFNSSFHNQIESEFSEYDESESLVKVAKQQHLISLSNANTEPLSSLRNANREVKEREEEIERVKSTVDIDVLTLKIAHLERKIDRCYFNVIVIT